MLPAPDFAALCWKQLRPFCPCRSHHGLLLPRAQVYAASCSRHVGKQHRCHMALPPEHPSSPCSTTPTARGHGRPAREAGATPRRGLPSGRTTVAWPAQPVGGRRGGRVGRRVGARVLALRAGPARARGGRARAPVWGVRAARAARAPGRPPGLLRAHGPGARVHHAGGPGTPPHKHPTAPLLGPLSSAPPAAGVCCVWVLA